MKKWLITKFWTLVSAKAGGLVQWVVGIVLGYATAQLLRLGVSLPEDLHHEIEMTLTATGVFAVTTAIQYIQNRNTVKVQASLGFPEHLQDGWIGPQTVKRAEEVVQ